MKLAQYYEVEPAMVYTIAAYHDLGLCEGREFHHLISGKILQPTKNYGNGLVKHNYKP